MPAITAPGGTFTLAGKPVARIGYGAMQLTPHGAPPIERAAAIVLLRQAIDLGINHIDTAEFYGSGEANRLIEAALHPYPADLVLATKVGAETSSNGDLVPAQRPEQLRASVEANLRALAAEQIDVVNLRRLDAPPGILATGDQVVDLDSQLAELEALKDEGKLGAIGLSNVSEAQVRHALPTGIACVQNAYSLLDRAADATLELCRDEDIAWVPFFPLGSAFPNRPKVTDDAIVRVMAIWLAATPAQIGLAWLLHRAPNILLIPGTRNPHHLTENIGAGHLRFTQEMFDALSDGTG